MYSDRHAATIVEIAKRRVVVQRDAAFRTDRNGMSDAQSYRHEPDPNGLIEAFTLRRNGRWVREGEATKHGTILAIGYRDSYHDFSF